MIYSCAVTDIRICLHLLLRVFCYPGLLLCLCSLCTGSRKHKKPTILHFLSVNFKNVLKVLLLMYLACMHTAMFMIHVVNGSILYLYILLLYKEANRVISCSRELEATQDWTPPWSTMWTALGRVKLHYSYAKHYD